MKTLFISMVSVLIMSVFTHAPKITSVSGVSTDGSSQSDSHMSRNWAGYETSGGTYTGVSGTWTVPQASSNGQFAADVTWVGIGGVSDHDLIQSGTQATIGRSGYVNYSAWLEMLPNPSSTIPLPINSGDSVSVSISKLATNQWQITFKNNTTGENYQTTTNYDSSLSSAEWIEEAPSTFRSFVPLDDFGTVKFTDASTIKNGNQMTISQAQAQPITMAGSRQILASPSSLGSDGSSFSIARSNSPTEVTAPYGYSGRSWRKVSGGFRRFRTFPRVIFRRGWD